MAPAALQVLGDDAGAADEILLALEAHRHGRRLGLAADHRRLGVGIDDGVADHVHVDAGKAVERAAQVVEGELLGFEQRDQLLVRQVRRRSLDQLGGGVDDVAGREDELAAVDVEHLLLLPGLARHAGGDVFVALGEVVGLHLAEVLERLGVAVDQHEVDHVQRGEIEGAQLLRHERAEVGFLDVLVAGDAGDQDVGAVGGIHQVADVAGMHDVEGAVAHDDLALARARADGGEELVDRLDLGLVFGVDHGTLPSASGDSVSNQVLVALAIESGSHSGASRQ